MKFSVFLLTSHYVGASHNLTLLSDLTESLKKKLEARKRLLASESSSINTQLKRSYAFLEEQEEETHKMLLAITQRCEEQVGILKHRIFRAIRSCSYKSKFPCLFTSESPNYILFYIFGEPPVILLSR